MSGAGRPAPDALDRVLGAEVAAGQVVLWWLGQASLWLRGRGASVLVDPYLTPAERRLVPPPVEAGAVRAVDAVVITHEHSDHLDRECVATLARRLTSAAWVAPRPIVDRLVDLGVDAGRVVGAEPGRAVPLDGVTLHPVTAHHGVTMADAYGDGAAPGGTARFLGYVLEFDGVRVYHSGDTLVFDGLVDEVTALRPDVALLPINGRDAFRERAGIVGNMSAGEAAQLATACGVDLLVPIHWDMFANNLGEPGHMVDLARRRPDAPSIAVLTPARPFVYARVGGGAPEGARPIRPR